MSEMKIYKNNNQLYIRFMRKEVRGVIRRCEQERSPIGTMFFDFCMYPDDGPCTMNGEVNSIDLYSDLELEDIPWILGRYINDRTSKNDHIKAGIKKYLMEILESEG